MALYVLSMDIWSAIRELIKIVEVGIGSEKENQKRLTYLLDYLALQIHSVDPNGDFDGKEISENSYEDIRKRASERFPNWGFYNVALDVSVKISETEIALGDAIDDISDITNDLKMVLWSYENENENNALWHLKDSYEGHWRWHARNLQVFIHCLENEI